MEKIVEQGILYDFYGELLTDHQKQVYELVVYENFSLAEIAQELGVSRQAVHDLIKRCDRILMDYEEKLRLIERFTKVREKAQQMETLLEALSDHELDPESDGYVSRLCELSQDIMPLL